MLDIYSMLEDLEREDALAYRESHPEEHYTPDTYNVFVKQDDGWTDYEFWFADPKIAGIAFGLMIAMVEEPRFIKETYVLLYDTKNDKLLNKYTKGDYDNG